MHVGSLSASLVIPWRTIWLRPRATVRERLNQPFQFSLLLLPVASGIVQSLVQGASNNVGARTDLWSILAFALPLGAILGIVQVHLMALGVCLVGWAMGEEVTFRRIRTATLLSHAPLATVAPLWAAGLLALGPDLLVDPGIIAGSLAPFWALQVALLYFVSTACMIWSLVVLVLGVAEASGQSIWFAMGALIGGAFIIGIAGAIVVVTAVIIL